MSKRYICLLCLLLPIIVWGQGFKGKTLLITPHISGIYIGDNDQIMNNVLTANVDIEKTINRSYSFGLRAYTQLNDEDFQWEAPITSRTINGQFTGYGYGVFLRRYFFNFGAIAPLGTFFQVGVSRNTYTVLDDLEVEELRLKTLAGSITYGLNWFLGNNVLLFSALEFKYELPDYPSGTDNDFAFRFNNELRETLPISFKLGLTIPIL